MMGLDNIAGPSQTPLLPNTAGGLKEKCRIRLHAMCLFYIGLATIMVSVVYVFNHYGANTARMLLRFSF